MRKGMLVIVPLKYTGGNMWLELMQHIKSTIDNSGAAFNVMLGAMRPQAAKVDENGVIMVIRGETTRGDNSIQSELEQELYIEVWGRNDNPDLEVGYELIANLEDRFEVIINDLRKRCGELDETTCILQNTGYQIIDLVCTSKIGDHDSVRPLVGTQYRFMVRLIDLKERTNGGIF